MFKELFRGPVSSDSYCVYFDCDCKHRDDVPQVEQGPQCQRRRCRWGQWGCVPRCPTQAPLQTQGSLCRQGRLSLGPRLPSAQSRSWPDPLGREVWRLWPRRWPAGSCSTWNHRKESCDHHVTEHRAVWAAAVDLLPEQDLRGPLAEHSVAAIVVPQHGAHGLPHGVEGVDLEQFLLWVFVADGLVVSVQVEGESQ